MSNTGNKLKRIFTSQLFINMAILVGLMTGLYLLLSFLFMPLFTRHWQGVKVPDVTYLSGNAAVKIVDASGLRFVKASEKYDENYPSGFVLFQSPEAGSLVKKGRRIYLTVGKGKQKIQVPGLVGRSIRDARFILEQSNLKLGNTFFQVDSFFHEGTISMQSIDSLVNVPVGKVIDLTVSLGYEPSVFIVPDLIGKSEEDARLAINRAGLTLGNISFQYTDRLVPKTVINQSRYSGSKVEKGDTLNIVISQLEGFKENLEW